MLNAAGAVFSSTSERPKCMSPGCYADADCLPKLWVPAHPLSPKKFDGVCSIMGMPMCFRHMSRLMPRQFVEKQTVRDSITADFRRKGAIPHFEKATLSYVRKREPEFQNWIDLHKLHRQLQA